MSEIQRFVEKKLEKKHGKKFIKILARLFILIEEYDKPISVRFIVPRHRNPATGEWTQMPTLLLDDQISNIPLEFDNLGHEAVDPPAGGAMTVSLDNAALGTVAMGADGTSVDFTPAVPPPAATEVGTITFSDTSGTITLPATLDIGITKDPAAANVHFKTDEITTRPIGP